MTIWHIGKEYRYQKNKHTQCDINKRPIHVVNRRRLFFYPVAIGQNNTVYYVN